MTGKEGGEGPMGQGSREGEGELGVVLTGTSGVRGKYVYILERDLRNHRT